MLSNDLPDRMSEIEGLTKLEVRMYDIAWKYNYECLEFRGLCNLWFHEVSPHIKLLNVYRVLDRLVSYMYFNTDNYLRKDLEKNGKR